MCRDREKFLNELIAPLIGSEIQECLIISDNSQNSSISDLIKTKYPNLKYKKRNNISASEHFNLIYQEVTSRFVMVFHDDDLISESFIKNIKNILRTMQEENYVAYGSNANVIDSNGTVLRVFNNKIKNDFIICSEEQLIRSYVDVEHGSIPFPSYVYKVEDLKKVVFGDENVGKYSDVIVLLKLLEFGRIYWSGEKNISYRIHGNNDSGEIDLVSLRNLCHFFEMKAPLLYPYIWDYFYAASVKVALNEKKITTCLNCSVFYICNPKRFFSRSLKQIKGFL